MEKHIKNQKVLHVNHYDAEGLRHEMEENGRLVSFIFRGTEVVTEETKEDRIRYIRTNELLASDAESARTYYHYASDEIGNITHVINDTNVINHYEYDVWGNLTVCEETIENRFKYNGQQFDPISQQYYLRARYYNPVIGRFTQEDTYRGDGLNLYAYCRNNPVFYIDPSGHMCEKGVDRVTGEINTRTATKDDVKNLSSHIREKLRNGGTLTDQEYRVANQLGIDVDKKSGTPSGYYQDANGRWRRPNGQFASNAEVGIANTSEHYLHRPYIRQSTIDVVNANTKVNYKTGQIYDEISKKWVDPSNVELGHTTGNEYWYWRNWAEAQGMTQEQFNDFMNNSEFYRWQEITSNRSHLYEDPH